MHATRHAIHPTQFKTFSTTQLREHFLVDQLFQKNDINLVYTHYDRLMIGGAQPVSTPLTLASIDALKADYFLERREIGIINVGAPGAILVDGTEYKLDNKEALYIGRGARTVIFSPAEGARFYFNAAPAHRTFPTRKISLQEADTAEVGSQESSNHRVIRKLIVNSVVETCQLQMGLTELKTGSVWNTMPPHTHDRRMEAYFYFDLPENHAVCHFIGEPTETRHLWVKNNEAVISPPWSVHSGAGTANYSFIWGMAGENLDYGDMDIVRPIDLR
ncbi:MAG TPA: 5-dehydro-4-deoxy-D-glucuronate isomerase [Ohtaekwangia sp.]|nr:5-dehydro-4-deoxy-D-glucuronate isomerase [Ohtaekwangia sp.]